MPIPFLRRLGLFLLALLAGAFLGQRQAQGLAPGPLALGPLVQLDGEGNGVLVWWTDRPGAGEARVFAPDGSLRAAVGATARRTDLFRRPLWQHVARLPRDLPRGRALPYRLLLDGRSLGGDVLRLPPRTPPLRIAVVGDYGTGGRAEVRVRDRIAAWDPDLILTTGDNAYGKGRPEEWARNVFGVYGGLMARVPFLPALGNHDNVTAAGAPYRDLFVLPENALLPEDRERAYSVQVGPVHLAVLDSTDALARAAAGRPDNEAEWLAADLAGAEVPWRIAVFHHPPYSAGAHGSHLGAWRVLVPALEAGGVQLVLNGHEHDYQRSCPIREDRCVPGWAGITYVVTGGGGAALRPTGRAWFTRQAASRHHALFLTVGSCVLHLEAVDDRGARFDEAWLDRCGPAWGRGTVDRRGP